MIGGGGGGIYFLVYPNIVFCFVLQGHVGLSYNLKLELV